MSNCLILSYLFDKKSIKAKFVIRPLQSFGIGRRVVDWLYAVDDNIVAGMTGEHLRQLSLVSLKFPLKINGHTGTCMLEKCIPIPHIKML